MIERLSWMKRMTFDLWPTGMTISREIPSTVRKKKSFIRREKNERNLHKNGIYCDAAREK
jgi:hypothetical protein